MMEYITIKLVEWSVGVSSVDHGTEHVSILVFTIKKSTRFFKMSPRSSLHG